MPSVFIDRTARILDQRRGQKWRYVIISSM